MSGCSSHKRLISGACVKQAISHSPPFKGGEAAQRPGWLVKGRVASLYARVAILIFFEITNHPVCAAEERDLLIEAQPPLLETEGNELSSTVFIDFEIACLRQSPESASGTGLVLFQFLIQLADEPV